MEEVTTLQLVEGATKLGAMSFVPSPPTQLSVACSIVKSGEPGSLFSHEHDVIKTFQK